MDRFKEKNSRLIRPEIGFFRPSLDENRRQDFRLEVRHQTENLLGHYLALTCTPFPVHFVGNFLNRQVHMDFMNYFQTFPYTETSGTYYIS